MKKQNASGSIPNLNPELESNKCPVCHGTYYVYTKDGVVPCECLIQARKIVTLGKRFALVTLENYKPRNESQKKAIEQVRKNPDGSYYFWGPLRSGKTYLLSAIFNRTIRNHPYQTRFITDRELKTSLVELVTGAKEHIPVSAREVKNGQLRILFWDDVGKAKVSAFLKQEIFALIDELYKRNGRIIITSNYPLEELADEDLLGGSSIRRIDDLCEIIKLGE